LTDPAFLVLFGLFVHVSSSLLNLLFNFVGWTWKFVNRQSFPAFQMCVFARKVRGILLPALNVIDLTGKMAHFLSHAFIVSEMTR
jgi:hypothetical protein